MVFGSCASHLSVSDKVIVSSNATFINAYDVNNNYTKLFSVAHGFSKPLRFQFSFDPFMSPDGTRVAFMSLTKLLVVFASNGTTVLARQIAQALTTPLWSEDSSTLFFVEAVAPRMYNLTAVTVATQRTKYSVSIAGGGTAVGPLSMIPGGTLIFGVNNTFVWYNAATGHLLGRNRRSSALGLNHFAPTISSTHALVSGGNFPVEGFLLSSLNASTADFSADTPPCSCCHGPATSFSLEDDSTSFASFGCYAFYGFKRSQVTWAYGWSGTGHNAYFGPAVDANKISYWCLANRDGDQTFTLAMSHKNGGSILWKEYVEDGSHNCFQHAIGPDGTLYFCSTSGIVAYQ